MDHDAADIAYTEEFVVAVNYDGWRLDRFLADQMKRATRAKVARIIRGAVSLRRGASLPKVKPGTIVRHGDVVAIHRIERADPATPALDEVRLVADTPRFVVVDKPAGMLVHRTAHEVTRTVDAFLARHAPGDRLEPAHRLDRDTSGLLVCGRGIEAIRTFGAMFERSEPRKVYQALVVDPDGSWPLGAQRTFDTPLGFATDSEVGIRVGAGDWECATTARALDRPAPGLARLEIEIDRGRQHQIRAHLFLFGTPVLGDKLYGMGDAFFLAWLDSPGAPDLVARLATRWHCLHASRLEFVLGGEAFAFSSPPPTWWPHAPVR